MRTPRFTADIVPYSFEYEYWRIGYRACWESVRDKHFAMKGQSIPAISEPCSVEDEKLAKNALVLAAENADELVLKFMKMYDIDVMTLSDCQEAISQFKEGKNYDIVLLDNMHNGPEVAKFLKEMAVQTLIIALVKDEDDLHTVGDEYVAAGVKYTFAKPLSKDGFEFALAMEGKITEPKLETFESLKQDDMLAKNALVLTAENADELLLKFLKAHNIDIIILSDYREAISQFQGGKHYDIVFLDNMDNGPEVAKSLEEMAVQTLIIGLIKNEDDLDTLGEEYEAAGVQYTFAKPLCEDGLVMALVTEGKIPEPKPDVTQHFIDLVRLTLFRRTFGNTLLSKDTRKGPEEAASFHEGRPADHSLGPATPSTAVAEAGCHAAGSPTLPQSRNEERSFMNDVFHHPV